MTEIQADTIQLLGKRGDNANAPAPAQPQNYGGGYNAHTQQQPQPQPQQTTPIVNPADLNDEGTDDLPF